MLETILFSFTAMVCTNYFFKVVGSMVNVNMRAPLPILHIFNTSCANTYISTPSIVYQFYFWGTYIGVLNG